MNDETRRNLGDVDHAWFLALCAWLSAVLSLLLLLGQPAVQDPARLLAYVADHRALIGLEAIAALMWTVFSVPVVVVLGQLLRVRSATLAATATILSAGGILLLGYSIRTSFGALLSVVAASARLDGPDAMYQAAIWRNLSFFLSDPGLMTWGLGQLLFGWLARNSRILPNWLAWVGIVGGLAGLFTDAVYQTGALAMIQVASFAVWGVVLGAMLFRQRAAN